jgi:preprotein translocase subunit SecF
MKKHLEKISSRIKGFYSKKYKLLISLVFIFFFTLLFSALIKNLRTGELVQRDITLKGGVVITLSIKTDEESSLIKQTLLSKFKDKNINFREIGITEKSLVVETSDLSEEDIINTLSNFDVIKNKEYTTVRIGASLGQSFYREILRAIIFSFILMGIIVLIYFRNLAPSSYIVFCAFLDITETLMIVSLLNIKLSSAGIAAFLMLIGYSVDTDILLTSRVLKSRFEEVDEKTFDAMKTGLAMILTTVGALVVGYFLSSSTVIKEIMLILIIGLLLDMFNTWIGNASFLKLYIERMEKHKSR